MRPLNFSGLPATTGKTFRGPQPDNRLGDAYGQWNIGNNNNTYSPFNQPTSSNSYTLTTANTL